uniref:Uncharacterized protein n=1 Tax=Plectus sambesii TaxID=2011161 RepID=A0A914XER3_9BILA
MYIETQPFNLNAADKGVEGGVMGWMKSCHEYVFTEKGRPTPEVEWLKDGTTLSNGPNHQIDTIASTTTLTIKSLERDDRGKYSLRVRNRVGDDEVSIGLQVTDRPDPPGKPTVQDQNLDSVRLLWATSMQDGGSQVRHYTVEMCKVGTDSWQKAEMTKQPFTTLFNLEAGRTYRFRVRADNVFGSSDPSEESEDVFVRDVTRQVVEPTPKEGRPAPGDSGPVDYEKQVSGPAPGEYRTIDVNRLPNDLQSKYIICEELGRGAYGTVYRAIERATGKTWAAKVVQVRPGVKRESVLHEINIMNQLHHEKLLYLHEAFDMGHEMCLIEELSVFF